MSHLWLYSPVLVVIFFRLGRQFYAYVPVEAILNLSPPCPSWLQYVLTGFFDDKILWVVRLSQAQHPRRPKAGSMHIVYIRTCSYFQSVAPVL